MDVVLNLMEHGEYSDWVSKQVISYASDKVRAGNWTELESVDRAKRELAELLPNGVTTKDHFIFRISDSVSQANVGHLWIKVANSSLGANAFIYSFEVADRQRGKGYGTAAIAAVEVYLATCGISKLSLHVFGFNTDARRLYERLGFEVSNVTMAKTID